MWVHTQAERLGVDPARIAIGGASAGAGLAAALAQLAHDRGQVKLVFQLLVYPMLDDRTCTRTDINDQGYLAWNPASNRFGWESYLGMQAGGVDPPLYAVPSRRADLSGLPPAWIGIGTLDMFYDEDVAYAEKLKESGVACELIVVPGAFHGFEMTAPQSRVARAFRDSQIEALRRCLLV
jgi:acetyl esterase/lipase